jgi:hypothetical protein
LRRHHGVRLRGHGPGWRRRQLAFSRHGAVTFRTLGGVGIPHVVAAGAVGAGGAPVESLCRSRWRRRR